MSAVGTDPRIDGVPSRAATVAHVVRGGGLVGSGMRRALTTAMATAPTTPTAPGERVHDAAEDAPRAPGLAPTSPEVNARPLSWSRRPTTLGESIGASSPGLPLAMASPPAPAATLAVPATSGAAATPSWATALPGAGAAYAPAVVDAARRHGLDDRLLAALVWTESSFDPAARSPAGAMGLGQLMPATAAELGVDPSDPLQNIDGAARYLRAQLDRFGDVRLALAAYNAGPGRVADAGGVPAITETTTYVARVTARAASLGG